MTGPLPFLPYPPIGRHGVIGDRRTAATIAADGTVGWLCLPHFDGSPLFGALLDAGRGGFWRVGPPEPSLGEQRYLGEGPVLTTRWAAPHGELELTDAMAWPWDDRDAAHGGEDGRVLLRRLRCTRGEAAAVSEVHPRLDFGDPPRIVPAPEGMTAEVAGRTAAFWGSRPGAVRSDGSTTGVALTRGEEVWFVLAWGEEERRPWTASRAAVALEETIAYWREWTAALAYDGPRGTRCGAPRRRSTS